MKVHLVSFAQDHSRRLYLVAERNVDLPVPPFTGLELFITELQRPVIERVLYDVGTGEWEAYEENVIITSEAKPIERLDQILREAGYEVTIRSWDDPRPPPRHIPRHLWLVPPGEGPHE
jgi:hypothetical protein